MSPFLLLVRMRVRDVTRTRSSFVLLFGLPLVLLAIVSLVFLQGHPFERRHVVVVGDGPAELPGVAVEHVPAGAERAALARLDSRMASAVVLGERVVVGERDVVFGRGVAASLPRTKVVEARALPRLGYVRYLLPGLLTFSVLVAGLFGVGYSMLRYREALFLKKLATTPLSRTTFVAAQIVARASLVVLQIAVVLAAATPLLGLSISLGAGLWLLALTLLGVLTFTGVGFALASVIRQEAQLSDVINASMTPLVLLSEIFFPVDALPGFLPQLAAALPTTQLVRMFRAVLLEGAVAGPAASVGVAVLMAWMAVSFTLAVLSFRWT